MTVLLDAAGNPIITGPRGVPFIRAFPNGATSLQLINVPAEIQFAADRFIANGGRYFIAIVGHEVTMAAALPGADGELYTVSEMVSPNSAALPVTIDRLVRASVQHLDVLQ